MARPIFSVVIPAFNSAKTLENTIKSVLNQTLQDFEIIVVNDGSTDETVSLIEKLLDHRVSIISQQNKGVSAARNKGISFAKGEYIAFLDSDDLWLPEKLQIQYDFLQKNQSVTAVQTGAIFINNDLEILSVRPCFESKDVLLETLLFQNLPSVMSTIVIKFTEIEKVGLFNENLLFEDWEFTVRLAHYGKFESIKQPLTLTRIHENNRSKDLSIHIESGDKILRSIFSNPSFPGYLIKKKRLIYSTFYRMLCGGAFNVGKYTEAIKWGIKSLIIYPINFGYIISFPLRRLQRKTSRKDISEYQQVIFNCFRQIK